MAKLLILTTKNPDKYYNKVKVLNDNKDTSEINDKDNPHLFNHIRGITNKPPDPAYKLDKLFRCRTKEGDCIWMHGVMKLEAKGKRGLDCNYKGYIVRLIESVIEQESLRGRLYDEIVIILHNSDIDSAGGFSDKIIRSEEESDLRSTIVYSVNDSILNNENTKIQPIKDEQFTIASFSHKEKESNIYEAIKACNEKPIDQWIEGIFNVINSLLIRDKQLSNPGVGEFNINWYKK